MAEEENVQVVLRLRPLSEKEKREGEQNVWKVFEGVSVILKKDIEEEMLTKKYTATQTAYNFDRCFGTMATNELVYEATIKHMVDSAVNGINATVFMYGQTGSGKTFTMLGYDQKKGVYNKTLAADAKRSKSQKKLGPAELSFEMKMQQRTLCEEAMEDTKLEHMNGLLIQALKDLFNKTKSSEDKTFFVKCSYVEIYNDMIYDLLQRAENISETLQVCEDTTKDQFYIRGVREEAIDDWTDAIEKLKRGEINRHYARTVMNHSSSRSHTIFRVYIQALSSSWNNKGNGNNPAYVTESWFNFVDLAGSEKISNHDQIEEGNKLQMRVKEGKHINKSLFFLTQVIQLKSEGKKVHIPYRNSPLTKILRTSLGGNSRTAIVLCVNPTYGHIEQTLSTIRFGLSAKKIQNRISANVVTRDDDEAVRIMIADYEKKLRDNERDRELLREREKKFMQKIMALEKKSVEWAKKMKVTQALKFADISGAVPEKDLETLLMDYNRHGHSHMHEAGILMFPANAHTKYSEYNKIMRQKVVETLQKESRMFPDYDQKVLQQAYLNPSGQWAMSLLERVKQSVGCDLDLYRRIQENWKELEFASSYQTVRQQLSETVKHAQESTAKVDLLIDVIDRDRETINSLKKKISHLEGKRDFTKLADEQLNDILSRYRETAQRAEDELKRRQIVKQLSAELPSLELDAAGLRSIADTLHKHREAQFEVSEDPEQPEEEEVYLEKLKDSCKKEREQNYSSFFEMEVVEGPDKNLLAQQLFTGCSEIIEKKEEFILNRSEYWKEYLGLVQKQHREAMEEFRERNKTREEILQKTNKNIDSLKGVWIDVDEILEKCHNPTTADESDNLSVSDVSAAPLRKTPQDATENISEADVYSNPEEGQKTPRIGGGSSDNGDEYEMEYMVDTLERDKEGDETEEAEYVSADDEEIDDDEKFRKKESYSISNTGAGNKGISQSQFEFIKEGKLEKNRKAEKSINRDFQHSNSLYTPNLAANKSSSNIGTPMRVRDNKNQPSKGRVSQSPRPLPRNDRDNKSTADLHSKSREPPLKREQKSQNETMDRSLSRPALKQKDSEDSSHDLRLPLKPSLDAKPGLVQPDKQSAYTSFRSPDVSVNDSLLDSNLMPLKLPPPSDNESMATVRSKQQSSDPKSQAAGAAVRRTRALRSGKKPDEE